MGDALEILSILRMVPGTTERLRLVTSVLVLPYRNPLLTAKMTAWLDATAVPASLRMLVPMKQIFGKSVAAEEPMVCMTHRYELRTPPVASGAVGTCPCSRLSWDLLLARELLRRAARRLCHRVSG